MREYVAQAVEKLAAIEALAWAPSTTPPLLQLGRVRGSDNDETAFDDGQEEDDEGVVTKGRRFRARRGGRRRRRDHCCALDRPNHSPPLAPEQKSWWRIFSDFSDFTFLPIRRRGHLEPYNSLCFTCSECPQGARSGKGPDNYFFKLLFIYFQFWCPPPC